ncbi:MAG: Hpt domain-containing protein [Pseudomonadota bacterium]|nr:Hpt domain-containing protein [Pseudomonadota bacterium]
MFERTAAYLNPETVVAYLRTIAELGTDVLNGLLKPEALTGTGEQLADTVHKLAGSASLFGFERLAAICRRFEYAVQAGAPETPALAEELQMTIAATHVEIDATISRTTKVLSR